MPSVVDHIPLHHSLLQESLKSFLDKLNEKLGRVFNSEYPENFTNGEIFFKDATETWPLEITDLDAIITSPPFFDSTRFYLANWIRLWFAGWGELEFSIEHNKFIDERQKQGFNCYQSILQQSMERIKPNGVVVFHLGKSNKCDMSERLIEVAKPWFSRYEVLNESVSHCESHGIKDKGTVTDHQYLVFY